MKRSTTAALVIGAAVLGLSAAVIGSRYMSPGILKAAHSTAGQPDVIVTGYVCPMHSHIHSKHPGPCPICGMDLVPDAAESSAGVGAPVAISPAAQANLGVRIARVARGEMHREIHTVGKLTRVDASAENVMSAPIAGHLSFVADKHEGDPVSEGELLFSIESDDLLAQEAKYVAAVKAGNQDEATNLSSALQQSGLGADEIAQLQGGAEPKLPLSFRAQKDGFVFTRRGEVGDEVTPGFTVFNVGGDKRQVEVTAEIFEQQWSWVHEGQTARIVLRGLPGHVFNGKVTRVDPPVGFATRSLEVRMEFDTDDEEVAQNLFGSVTIEADARPDVLNVPSEAVIHTEQGDRVVTLTRDGRFRSVAVTCGEDAGGRTEIRSGLEAGQPIVASGQFLIDSESSRLAELARLDRFGSAAGTKAAQ